MKSISSQINVSLYKLTFMRCLIYFLLLVSCQLSAQTITLELENASSSENLVKGDTIHIWSDKTPSSDVFSHWSGTAIDYLQKVDEWHTILVIPENINQSAFTLTANYETIIEPNIGVISIIQWGQETEEGDFFPAEKEIHFAYPNNPKAIAFFIHGTGGNADSWFSNFEKLSMVKDFVHEGYAVFALNSNETSLGDQDGDGQVRWENNFSKQDTFTNIDFKNVIHTKQYIDANLGFGDLPVVMVGGSNGANFSEFCTGVLDFTASAHLTGNGNSTYFNNFPELKPVIWVQSRNDNNQNASAVTAQANFQKLVDQGVKTEWYWLEKSPSYSKRYMRNLNGTGEAISTSIHESLKNQGLLDEDDFLIFDNVNTEFPADFFDNFDISNAQRKDIEYQLNVINADHIANGDYNKTIIKFFDDCLSQTTNTVDEALSTNQFEISPNPAEYATFIRQEKHSSYDFQLVDISGKILKEGNSSSSDFEVDLSRFSSGIYFLIINTGYSEEVHKVIKK